MSKARASARQTGSGRGAWPTLPTVCACVASTGGRPDARNAAAAPRCEYDVLNAPSYLPREDPASSPLACHQAKHFRYGVSDLRALLRAQQQPSNPVHFAPARRHSSDKSALMVHKDQHLRSGCLFQAMCTRVGLFHPDIVSAFGVNLRSLAIALGTCRILSCPWGPLALWRSSHDRGFSGREVDASWKTSRDRRKLVSHSA